MRSIATAVVSVLVVVATGCTGDDAALDEINTQAEAAVSAWLAGPLDDPERLDDLSEDLGDLSVQAQAKSSSLDVCRLFDLLPRNAEIVDSLESVVCDTDDDLTFRFEGFVLATALVATSSDDAAQTLTAELPSPVTESSILDFIKDGEGSYRDLSLLAEVLTGRPDRLR